MASAHHARLLAIVASTFAWSSAACMSKGPSEEAAPAEQVAKSPERPPEVPPPVDGAETSEGTETSTGTETSGTEAATFDPLTATEAKVRITKVHRRHWTACGIVHTVGAIEVEVLEVGEPPPKMALIVSCPADLGGKLLEEGKILQVTLHRKRQPWPRPTVAPPEDLPVRYVRSLALAVPSLGGAP